MRAQIIDSMYEAGATDKTPIQMAVIREPQTEGAGSIPPGAVPMEMSPSSADKKFKCSGCNKFFGTLVK